ncbi:MAG: sn-glycerol-1-phosphate dehydrogenase, partial [Geminicoccaceae bacterium]
LCRGTAQVDWLLSHHLLGSAYMTTPFTLQHQDEAALLAKIGDLKGGDPDAMRVLVRLLVLGGFGMLLAGNSQPGSQGEHLISHYIDMFQHPHPGSLHGEQVGLATWTMACLQHDVLARDRPPALKPTHIDAAGMAKRYGRLDRHCRQALVGKALDGNRLDLMTARLEQGWQDMREHLNGVAMPLTELRAALEAAGVVIEPEALGISSPAYRDIVRHARELRDRYTMLDLAADAGLLDLFIDRHLAQ